jgi:hypothetical protein
MKRYKNLSGDSGVVAYEVHPRRIDIRFTNGRTYKYTSRSAGADNIELMKKLAVAGRGLSTFISQVVKDGYEDSW